MIRQTVAHVDLGALAHNACAIRAFMAAGRGEAEPLLAGVVKADGYGHGAVEAARTLLDAGASLLSGLRDGRAAAGSATSLICGVPRGAEPRAGKPGRLLPRWRRRS